MFEMKNRGRLSFMIVKKNDSVVTGGVAFLILHKGNEDLGGRDNER